jgi:hypothetical protein
VKLGKRSGLLDVAIFLAIFLVSLALYKRGLPDLTGLVWWSFVLLASIYLVWKGWTVRRAVNPGASPGGWGAVLPAKVSRWMLGEEDGTTKSDQSAKAHRSTRRR